MTDEDKADSPEDARTRIRAMLPAALDLVEGLVHCRQPREDGKLVPASVVGHMRQAAFDIIDRCVQKDFLGDDTATEIEIRLVEPDA